MEKENDKASRRFGSDVEFADLGKALLSHVIDLLLVAAIWVVSYFAICYPTTVFSPDVSAALAYERQAEEEYGLTLPGTLGYEEYKEAVDDFYFVYFPKEIEETFARFDEHDPLTVEAYYNYRVLGLERDPSPDYKGNGIANYVKGEDGSFDVNQVAVISDNLSSRGEDTLLQTYRSAYDELSIMLRTLDPEFGAAYNLTNSSMLYGIAASFSFSYLICFLVLPMLLPLRATAGEAMLSLGTADGDGLVTKRYKILLRALLGFPLPFVGAFFFNVYSVVLCIALPIFANMAYPIVRGRQQTWLDCIFGIKVVVKASSTVYESDLDRRLADKNAIPSYVDPEYVTKLAATEEMELEDEEK